MTEHEELDLHADSERWQDNLSQAVCDACGGERVVFIPVWADGGGILTADEIAEILDRAELRVLELGEAEKSRRLKPFTDAMPDDIVMHIDGRRDGTYRAVIIARGGDTGQAFQRYGRGSSYRGAVGWRMGLRHSMRTRLDTSPEEESEGLLAYEGEPGAIRFMAPQSLYQPKTPEAQEAYRIRRGLRDRTSRTGYAQRHRTDRPPRPSPAAEGDAGDRAGDGSSGG